MRRKLVLWIARLLRVRLYNHWSEMPVSDVSLCAFCDADATVSRCGTPCCCVHDDAISESRLRSGRTGKVLDSEAVVYDCL